MTIDLKLDVSREVLEGIFITAIEGGSNYWYYIGEEAVKAINNVCPRATGISFSERVFMAVHDYCIEVPIHDIEDIDGEPIGVLSIDTFKERLERCANEGCMWALQQEIDEQGDATTSDAVFQYLALNDLVYG
jgi:ribosomal protein S27AE